eukprot:jgi/Botrbrau1/15624/Bobra.4_1s0011.1
MNMGNAVVKTFNSSENVDPVDSAAENKMIFVNTPEVLYICPVMGVPIRSPNIPPCAGDVFLGYQLHSPKLGYNASFTTVGWIATAVLIAVAWPIFWIPAVLPALHEAYQCPVYGQPGTTRYVRLHELHVQGFPTPEAGLSPLYPEDSIGSSTSYPVAQTTKCEV